MLKKKLLGTTVLAVALSSVNALAQQSVTALTYESGNRTRLTITGTWDPAQPLTVCQTALLETTITDSTTSVSHAMTKVANTQRYPYIDDNGDAVILLCHEKVDSHSATMMDLAVDLVSQAGGTSSTADAGLTVTNYSMYKSDAHDFIDDDYTIFYFDPGAGQAQGDRYTTASVAPGDGRKILPNVGDTKEPGSVVAYNNSLLLIADINSLHTTSVKVAVLFRSGATISSFSADPKGMLIIPRSGLSRQDPIVIGSYRDSMDVFGDLVTFDCATNDTAFIYFASQNQDYWVFEDSVFEAYGDPSTGSSRSRGVWMRGTETLSYQGIWFGSMVLKDFPNRGIHLASMERPTGPGATGLVFIRPVLDNVSTKEGTGACITIDAPSNESTVDRMYVENGYFYNGFIAPPGGSNGQAHGMYIKGASNDVEVNGAVFPGGPGAAIKADSMGGLWVHDVLSFNRKGGFNIEVNGQTSLVSRIDRSEKSNGAISARHNLIENFVIDSTAISGLVLNFSNADDSVMQDGLVIAPHSNQSVISFRNRTGAADEPCRPDADGDGDNSNDPFVCQLLRGRHAADGYRSGVNHVTLVASGSLFGPKYTVSDEYDCNVINETCDPFTQGYHDYFVQNSVLYSSDDSRELITGGNGSNTSILYLDAHTPVGAAERISFEMTDTLLWREDNMGVGTEIGAYIDGPNTYDSLHGPTGLSSVMPAIKSSTVFQDPQLQDASFTFADHIAILDAAGLLTNEDGDPGNVVDANDWIALYVDYLSDQSTADDAIDMRHDAMKRLFYAHSPMTPVSGDPGHRWGFGAGCSRADVFPAGGDGNLNFFDTNDYLALYTAGVAAADLAVPFGEINFFDLAEFIEYFSIGCE